MKKPLKRYILWVANGNYGYSPTEFDTVEEALTYTKYTDDWYLTLGIESLEIKTFTVKQDEN